MKKIYIMIVAALLLAGCSRQEDNRVLVCTDSAGVGTFRSDKIWHAFEDEGTWSLYSSGGEGSYRQKPGEYCRAREIRTENN